MEAPGAGLACAVVVVLAVMARPVPPVVMDMGFRLLPRLPAGQGIRAGNNLGGFHEVHLQSRPERGTFLGVRRYPRTMGRTRDDCLGAAAPPLAVDRLAPVRYSTPGMGARTRSPPCHGCCHNVRIAAGQEIFLGFPFHMWPCTINDGWEATAFPKRPVPDFHAHRGVPWGMEGDAVVKAVARAGKPGQKGVTCAPGPHGGTGRRCPLSHRVPCCRWQASSAFAKGSCRRRRALFR